MIEKLAKILFDSGIQFHKSYVSFSGTNKFKSENSQKILSYVSKEKFKIFECLEFLAENDGNQSDLIQRAVQFCKDEIKAQRLKNTPSMKVDSIKREEVRKFFRFVHKVDGTVRDPGYVIDTRNYEITSLSFEAYKRYFTKEEVEDLNIDAPVVDVKFLPRRKDSDILYYDSDLAYHILNSYVAPDYLKLIKKATTQIPPKIEEFLNFFTNDNIQERDNLLLWVYECVFKRAPTYLCLISDPGTGKTTLFGNLVHSLVGKKNFTPTKGDFNKNTFNQYLDKTLYVLLDEFECLSDNDKDNMKRIQNDIIQIEGKGSNQKTIINHCSFIICNNEMDAIRQDPLDRKFYFPKITNKKILTTKGKEFIDEYLAEVEDDECLAQFYNYLLEKYTKYKYSSTELIPKNHWHEEVILATAPASIKQTLQDFIAKKMFKITYAEARESYMADRTKGHSYFLGEFKFRRYFKNFTWHGKKIFKVNETDVYLLNENGETYFDENKITEMPGDE